MATHRFPTLWVSLLFLNSFQGLATSRLAQTRVQQSKSFVTPSNSLGGKHGGGSVGFKAGLGMLSPVHPSLRRRRRDVLIARHEGCEACGSGPSTSAALKEFDMKDRIGEGGKEHGAHTHRHHHGHKHEHGDAHSHNHGHDKTSSSGGTLAVNSNPPEAKTVSEMFVIKDMLKSLWRKDPGLALTGSILLVSAKTVKIMVPLLYKLIFDHIGGVATSTSAVMTISALVVAHMCARSLAQGLQSINDVIFARSVQGVTRDLGQRSLRHLLDLDMNFYTRANLGSITRVVERGMRATHTVLSRLFMHLIPQAVELGIVAYIIYEKAGFAMAAGSVLTVVVYALFTLSTVKRRNMYLRDMNTHDNKATGRVLETLLNHEVVNAFNRQDHQVEGYDDQVKKYQKAQMGSLSQLAILNFGQRTIEAVGQGALLLKTAFMVSTGTMTIGELLMVNALLAQLMGPLDHLGANYMQLTQGLVDGKELYQMIETPSNVSMNSGSPPLRVTGGEIQIQNVNFQFPQTEGERLFSNFSLTIPSGKTVAIVGESGCGKSTLSRLITRAYDVEGGTITIDGQDISKVSLESLRDAVAIVPQDTKLFNQDIMYNLKYGAPSAPDEQVQQIVDKVQLSGEIASMRDGYQTSVGDRGSRLSGGQRQRAGLGRALLKDPNILICDEVTGALDVGTESRVMHSLQDLRRGKTTILIAHRLATVKDADEIIVMSKGNIVERGTHQLLTKDPTSLYSAMWQQQLQDAKDSETPSSGSHSHHHHHHHDEEHDQDLHASGHDSHSDACGCGHDH